MSKIHIAFADVPVCQVGMGVINAYRNGFKHGYQGKVTKGVNCLTKGTDEFTAWEVGYTDGESLAYDD